MLTKEDAELLKAYRDLTAEQRKAVLEFIRTTVLTSSERQEATCDSRDQLDALVI